MSRDEKIAYWRGILQEHAESGLTGAAFCRSKGLTISQFRWWSRRFRKHREQPPEPDEGFVELVAAHSEVTDLSSGVAVEVGPGMRITVARSFDPETLWSVLQVVGAAAR